jgi:hypothetical protein
MQSDDGRYIVQADEAALVIPADGEPRLLIPHGEMVSPLHVVLTGVFLRWMKEPDWQEEMLEWMDEQRRSLPR